MYQTTSKILNWEELSKKIGSWRVTAKKIVFTNGCFDLLHIGHVDYLEKARQLGDVLIVGLNTDASVSKLKGPNRPIQDQNSRARVMAALEFVDAVTFFEQDTPAELIDLVVPDVLVKGGDYEIEEIVGYDTVTQAGGKVLTIDLVIGYSTSNIEAKIKANE